LVVAPSGAVLTVNAGDGRMVVTNPTGKQIAAAVLDAPGKPKGAGALGLLLAKSGLLYVVNDATNTFKSFTSSGLRAMVG